MFCPKCGANLIDGAEFCQKCGAQIKKKEEPAPQQAPVYSQPTAAPAAVVAPNRSKTPIIIAVCAVVVVLIAAIVAVIAISALKGNDSQVSSGYGWEENENDTSSDLPEFCGKYNGGVLYATSYVNEYFGFKVNLDSSWSFANDSQIAEALGAETKSTVDLSNLDFAANFTDMVATDANIDNLICVQFLYYGGTAIDPFEEYSSEDEIMADILSGFCSNYSESNGEYIDYSTYGNKAYLGGLEMTTVSVTFYYDDGTVSYEKNYFMRKDDVVILISNDSTDANGIPAIESMFSPA